MVALAFGPSRADAQEFACLDGRLSVSSDVGERWSAEIADACLALERAEDTDPEIVLHLSPDGEALLIEAILPDGRRASRHVAASGGLLATLEALALLPLHRSTAPAPTPQGADAPIAAPAPVVPQPSGPSLAVELGSYGGVRGYGARAYVGAALGGYAMLRVGSIGLALTARWEPIVKPIDLDASGFEMSSFAVGFVATRRVRANERLVFDLGAGAQIVTLSQHYDRASGEFLHSETDARVGVVARMLVGRGPWAFLVTVDAELSPERTIRPLRLEPDLPTLPGYSFGVATGFAWGAR